MIKRILKIIFSMILLSLFGTSFASIYIEGGDKQVYYGDNIELVGNLDGIVCESYQYDWSLYGGDVWLNHNSPVLNLNIDAEYNYVMFMVKCNHMTHVEDIISSPIKISLLPPVVNPGGTTSRFSSGDLVNLSGSISGTPCSVFSYYWEQVSGETVTIMNHEQIEHFSPYYDGASFVFPDGTEDITLKLSVRPSSCFHSLETFSGTVTYYRSTEPVPTLYPSVAISGGNITIPGNTTTSLQAVLTDIDETKCNIGFKWAFSGTALGSINDYYSQFPQYTSPNISGSDNIVVTANVTSKDTLDPCLVVGSYFAQTIIQTSVSTTPVAPIQSGGGGPRIDKNKQQANEIIANPSLLKDKLLELKISIQKLPIIELTTFDFNADSYVEYIYEYSTGYSFENPYTIKSFGNTTYIYPYILDSNSIIHFFRVKACLGEICTKYSNVISYTANDNPLSIYQVKCKNCTKKISFMDILESHYYFILDKYYKTKECNGKCSKIDYTKSSIIGINNKRN